MRIFSGKDGGTRIVAGRLIGFLVSLLFLWFVGAPLIEKCSEMPGSPELQTGQRIIYQMAGRENLQQVDFFENHPGANPSDFVEMVSDPDHVLWPPPPPDSDSAMAVRKDTKRIYAPDGLVFSPRERQTTDSDEIVFDADDAERQLIVRGYSPGNDEATFEYVWDFPTSAGKVALR